MFCADYIASFIYHASFTLGLVHLGSSPHYGDKVKKTVQLSNPFHLYAIGALSGFCGATSVFPFDFVRRGVLHDQKLKLRHSLSTVPYAALFFGLYFHFRDRNSTSSQCKWALVSASSAAVAEVPFDKAKLAMMGNRKTMLMAGLLYVPFGALMLVMYDKAMANLEVKVTGSKWW